MKTTEVREIAAEGFQVGHYSHQWWARVKFKCVCGKRHVVMADGPGETPEKIETSCPETHAALIIWPWNHGK